MPVPQVIISLAPSGELQAELPGSNGSRRVVPIHDLTSIYRILSAQLVQPINIGLDSSPTSGQVKHWEKHSIFKVDTCPWCVAESLGIDVSRKRARPIKMHIGDGSVTVTRYKAKSTSRNPKPINLSALEELL